MTGVRAATRADAAAIAIINADGWRTNYVGLIPASRLATIVPEPEKWTAAIERASRPWHVSVATRDGNVLGFATVLPMRNATSAAAGYDGEISALYAAPARQRSGIGRALFDHVRAAAAADSWAGIGVWTLADSPQSCGFYAATGGGRSARVPT